MREACARGAPDLSGRMSKVLARFAAPWLERLPESAGDEVVQVVLRFAALAWNAGAGGEALNALDLLVGRGIFASLGWDDDVEAEIRKLARRKAVLFPDEKRLVFHVEVERGAGGQREIYAAT